MRGFSSVNDASKLKFEKLLSSGSSLHLGELQIVVADQQTRQLRRRPPALQLMAQVNENCSRFASIRGKQSVMGARKGLEGENLHHFEISQLLNLLPKSTEEAKALIPSLEKFADSKVDSILDSIDEFRFSTC